MMELDNQDPRVKTMLLRMVRQLAHFVDHGYGWNLQTVSAAEDMVEALRAEFKSAHGYEFPPMVAFYMPSVEFLQFYRADLEYATIREQMMILAQKLSRRGIKPDAMEMSAAMIRAWPHTVKRRETDIDDIEATAKRHHIKTTTVH